MHVQGALFSHQNSLSHAFVTTLVGGIYSCPACVVYPSKGVSELALHSHNMPTWCAASNAIDKYSLQPKVPVSTKSPCIDNCYYIFSSITALSSLWW